MSKFLGWIGMILVLLVLIGYAPIVILPMMDTKLYRVVSASMEPEILTDSLIGVKEKNASDITVGEVIAYLPVNERVEVPTTHRVIEHDTGRRYFITKGDANHMADANPVSYAQLEGVVQWHVPYVGALYHFLTTKTGKYGSIILLLIGAGLFGAETILNKKLRKKQNH